MRGLLVIDKPEGLTSFDVVKRVRARARRLSGLKKIKVGHTGTLDPFATGVLPIAIGDATRLCEYLIEGDKHYRATMELGARTDTDDSTGEVLETRELVGLDPEVVREAILGLKGSFVQIPPRFSAIHVDGQRAYKLARRGEEFELEGRAVEVKTVEALRVALPLVDFEVRTSKGTYIRAICRDLGESLGVFGHCKALRRLSSAGFGLEQALGLDEVMEGSIEDWARWFLPMEAMTRSLAAITVDAQGAVDLRHGKRLAVDHPFEEGRVVAVSHEGELVCIGVVEADARIKPSKVFLG